MAKLVKIHRACGDGAAFPLQWQLWLFMPSQYIIQRAEALHPHQAENLHALHQIRGEVAHQVSAKEHRRAQLSKNKTNMNNKKEPEGSFLLFGRRFNQLKY